MMRPGSRFAALLVVIASAFWFTDCSEKPTGSGSGGLALDLEVPSHREAERESLSVWIEDVRGDLLSGPARVAWGTEEESFEVSLDVPEGNGRRVWASLDAEGWQGRGLIALGSRGNVRVRATTLTDVTVELADVVPRISPVVAQPGDLEYRVHWSRVPGAERYELLEKIGDELAVYVTPDTARSFPLLAGENAFYRVRALLATGMSVYTDSVRVDRALLADLPRIVAVDPPDGEPGVLDTTVPRVTFDRPMDWSTLEQDQVRIVEVGSGEPLAMNANGAPGEAELFLSHSEPFVRGKSYRIEVDPGQLRDFEGRPYDQDSGELGLQGFRSAFGSELYSPLFVTGVSPSDSAEAVAITADVTVTFNRPFDPESVDEQSVRLLDDSGSPVACARALEEQSVRLTPDQDLAYDAVYRVEVTTDVHDLRGEPLDQDPSTPIPTFEGFTASFRVEPQPSGPMVSAVAPVSEELNAASFTTIEIEFSRPVDPNSVSVPTTLAVRKLPIQANIAGTLTADGSDRFIFTPAAPLEAGTRYRIVVTTGVHDSMGVPLDQDPSTPGFQSFQSEFRVERTIQVTSTVPANNANRVPVTQVVAVQLSSPVDPASLSESSLRLERGGEPVEGDRTLSGDNRTALLTPHEPLHRFTQYTVRVTAELRGADGGRLDQSPVQIGYQEFTSRFTTQPESIPPMVTAVLPQDGASGVSVRPQVEVAFNKPVLPASVNDETFLLRNVGNGSLVNGALTVADDSMSASFEPMFDLSRSTEYEIEITNWIVDRFDVRLDQDPITPDRQGFKSRFQTDNEHVSPRVSTIAPADSATHVPIDAVVEIDFDEPIAAATVSGVTVRDQSGQLVSGTLSLGNGDARVTFQPSAPLFLVQRYDVRVDTTVTDRTGNPLDQDPETAPLEPFLSLFWTVGDELSPRVVSVIPADESGEIDLDTSVRLGFSEPIDPATSSGAMLLDSLGAEIPAQILLVENDSLEILPDDPLQFDHRYAVSVTSIADSAGNLLDQNPSTEALDPFLSHFRTHREDIRPTVTQVRYDAPSGDPPPVTTRIWIAFSEAIDPSSLDPEDVLLSEDGDEVLTTVTFPASDTIRIVPNEPLLPGTRYELTVSGLADLVGNPFDQVPNTGPLDRYETAFETVPDTEPPRVLASIPAHGAEGVLPEQIITVTFSEPMDSTTVDPQHLQLVRVDGSHDFPVSGAISVGSDLTEFLFLPQNPLLPGYIHEIRGDFFLEDQAGNPLDQNPDTPQTELFVAAFLVGSYPVADAGGAICDPSDSSAVHVDGSGSFDPDGSIVSLVWVWGDGTETEIDSPAPADFMQDHVYACSDIAGCDGLDNDGDGETDEVDLCDESHRIILRVRDDTGLIAADTIGVSFCGFSARAVEPMDEATGVGILLTEARITFSRPVALAALTTTNFKLLDGGVDTGRVIAVDPGDNATEVVLTLAGPLASATTYTISAETTVVDPEGRNLDHDLCAPGLQAFTSEFTTTP